MAGRMMERRKARKKWRLRIAETVSRSDLRCAACNDRAPPVPIDSRYSEPRLLERMWRCAGCGNQWTTSTKVPS
jgi:ribosomal protein L37AE/L43A